MFLLLETGIDLDEIRPKPLPARSHAFPDGKMILLSPGLIREPGSEPIYSLVRLTGTHPELREAPSRLSEKNLHFADSSHRSAEERGSARFFGFRSAILERCPWKRSEFYD